MEESEVQIISEEGMMIETFTVKTDSATPETENKEAEDGPPQTSIVTVDGDSVAPLVSLSSLDSSC